MQQDKYFGIKLFISIILFAVSGFTSTYLAYLFESKGGIYFSGLLYTSSTIFIFLLAKKQFTTRNLLSYYLLMNVTYVALYFLTVFSFYAGFVVGIFAAGIGAIATFALTDKYITRIEFNKLHLFIVGGIAFLITDILQFTFISYFDEPVFEYLFKLNSSDYTLFVEVFFFWQLLVGTKLFLTLQKKTGIISKQSKPTGSKCDSLLYSKRSI